MKRLAAGIVVVVVLAFGSTAWGAYTFEIHSLINEQIDDPTATFAGTGFVGMYHTAQEQQPTSPYDEGTWTVTEGFVPIFGVRMYYQPELEIDYTTNLNVDVSSLAGSNITSATLSFIATRSEYGGVASLISYDADGTLRHSWPGPTTNLGEIVSVHGISTVFVR